MTAEEEATARSFLVDLNVSFDCMHAYLVDIRKDLQAMHATMNRIELSMSAPNLSRTERAVALALMKSARRV